MATLFLMVGLPGSGRAGVPPRQHEPEAVGAEHRVGHHRTYRFTRNPMYLGFTLFYLGVALWINTAWPLLFLPIVLVVMHHGVIVREEASMARTFGEDYERYRQRVRRWL